MGKKYLNENVYEATMERLDYIFTKFDHVVIAFSGGKDSGLLLELVYQYYEKKQPSTKVTVYHIDYEGAYQYTLDYVERCMGKYTAHFDYYHICMPLSASCGISMYHSTWVPWNPAEKDIWLRQPPENAITLDNHNFDFFEIGMSDYLFQTKLSKWLHKEKAAKHTAILVGLRAQESLHRYHAVTRNSAFNMYGRIRYSKRITPKIFNFYPMYDWIVEDVWTAYAKYGWDYNKLYDLYYQAGLSINEMRVANPFHDCGVETLKLYKVIEPATWGKLIGRVNGVNFGAIYGGSKAVGYRNITLPPGHTWKSYTNFLLKTLPENTRRIYQKKFQSSKRYWLEKGGALPVPVIEELRKNGYKFDDLGIPQNKRKYKNEYRIIRFHTYPDEVNVKNFRLIPSYKRMCITILKNDTSCRYMGFGQTKDELQRQKEAMALWGEIS
jgi:predicted phosphoadenosine phosphosulfate sulfurtransferase